MAGKWTCKNPQVTFGDKTYTDDYIFDHCPPNTTIIFFALETNRIMLIFMLDSCVLFMKKTTFGDFNVSENLKMIGQLK